MNNTQIEESVNALFFSKYYGQFIGASIESGAPNTPTYVMIGNHLKMGPDYLLLRSIDQLTDEEAINISRIIIEDPFTRYRNILVSRDFKITGFPYIAVSHQSVRYRLNIDCTHVNFSVIDMEEDISSQIDMKPYGCIDYLRSIGILIPFTYLDKDNKPVTLQPSDLIEMGWAKYQQS